jgi:uncharacterized protein YbaR (Trm112 family)
MQCPHCREDLARITADGDPMLRTRGLLFKGGSLVLVCPKCKGDVRPGADLMKALQNVSVLFFKSPPSA